MKRTQKILLALLGLALVGAIVIIVMINKPHRKAEDEKGIPVVAAALVQAYQSNEQTANKTYLNKTLEVKGILKEAGKNQAGQPTALFESEDPMSSVFCTMRDKNVALTPGKEITVKGFCSGYTTDVLLTDCILTNQ